jgi:diguanylate cyclase (GGDEF)-like protein
LKVPGRVHLYKSAARWQRFAQLLFALDRKLALALCILVFTGIAGLDYITPPQLNLTFLYVFVVIIACWNVGLGWGLSFAAMSFMMQVIAFSQIQNPGITPFYFFVILGNRLFTFLLVVALTIPLRKLYEREQKTARIDFLTGVPNRKAFFDMLGIELARNRRTGVAFSVAYLDLDNFKQVNDEFGHNEGDALLRATVDTVRSALRTTDMLARLGGDEFAILLPDADQAIAEQCVGRVKDALDACMSSHQWKVTASIGLGTFNRPGLSEDGVMTACDALMYRVKHGGKSAIAAEHFVAGSNAGKAKNGRQQSRPA